MRPVESRVAPPAAMLAALLLAGCAARGGWVGPGEPAPPFADPQLTVAAAASSLAIGQSRKADVQPRLGPAEVVRFDTGYEVWVYRSRGLHDPRAAPELVLLFQPSGVLAKVRARPAYARPDQARSASSAS